jgi:hypothetical protein
MMTTKLQNNWLRNLIPDEFTDLDYLFEEVLFEGLIFFWEEDNGEEMLSNYTLYTEEEGFQARKECFDAMLAAYEWAKPRKKMEPKAPSVHDIGSDAYLKRAEKYWEKEIAWKEEKTKHLLNIVKYRGQLWS